MKVDKMSKDTLFKVIKSLSKSEKRYIKLELNSDKKENYIILFTAYESMININETILVLPPSFPIERLPAIRNYLKSKLFVILSRFHYKSNKKSEVLGKLQQIEALFNKRLYDECARSLRKIEKIVKDYWIYNLWLEVTLWQLRLMLSDGYKDELKMSISELYEKEENILDALTQIYSYRKIRYKLLSFSTANLINSNHDDLQEDIDNILLKLKSPSIYPYSKLEYNRTMSLYHKAIKNYDFALSFSRKELDIWEQNPRIINDRIMTSKYINGHINYCNLLVILGKHSSCKEHLQKIKILQETSLFREKTSNNYYSLLTQCYLLEINLNIALKAFDKNKPLIRKVTTYLIDKKINKKSASLFAYKFAYNAFCLHNWDETLEYTNQIINEFYGCNNETLMSFAKFLQILIHFELEHVDLVERLSLCYHYEIKEIKLILKYIGLINNVVYSKEKIQLFQELKRDLETHLEENNVFVKEHYFNFLWWVNVQISKA